MHFRTASLAENGRAAPAMDHAEAAIVAGTHLHDAQPHAA